MRIVSLIPSGTDLVAALGLEQFLVGVSHECDHEVAHGLPILTSSIIPTGLEPAAIDRCVSEALQQPDTNGSLYRTDRELLRAFQPDLIITQEICDVCAVNASSALCELPPGARVLTLSATDFSGLWNDLRAVANATGSSAENLILSLQARLDAVQRAVEHKARLRVLTLEWTDPPFIGGHWVPEIIECVGGADVLGTTGEPSRRATWDEIATSDPDVILLLPCGYGLEQTAHQGRALLQRPEYSKLRAVQNGNVWATDATRLFSRCTPATVRAVEVVAGILHPDVWLAHTTGFALRLQC